MYTFNRSAFHLYKRYEQYGSASARGTLRSPGADSLPLWVRSHPTWEGVFFSGIESAAVGERAAESIVARVGPAINGSRISARGAPGLVDAEEQCAGSSWGILRT